MLRIGLFLLTNIAVIAVASITLSLLGVGSYLDAQGGINLNNLLVFAAVFGFGGAFVSLFLSKWMAKMSTRTVIISEPKSEAELWLLSTVKELSEKAGIGMPEVGVFPAHQSNAFATGWNRNDALVAVSAGLLQRMDKSEIRAVLAHEIGHVANGDMVTLSLIQGVVNTFVIFFARIIGYLVDRVILKNESGHGLGFFLTSIVAEIILGFFASMIVMWFSRRREFRADEMGAQLAGTGAMIGALEKLRREAGAQDEMPDTLQAFAISKGQRSGLAELFASHPPLEERIMALKARTAGIDRG